MDISRLSLSVGIFTWHQNKKKVSKKVLFSLMARPLPPPLLMDRPLVEEFFLRLPLSNLLTTEFFLFLNIYSYVILY